VRKENTIISRHVTGGARVHDPATLLHLVEGDNQTVGTPKTPGATRRQCAPVEAHREDKGQMPHAKRHRQDAAADQYLG
jgi:hypothetical protein